MKSLKTAEYLIIVATLLVAYWVQFATGKRLDLWWVTAIPAVLYLLLSHFYSGRSQARGSKKVSLIIGALAGVLCLAIAYLYYDAYASYALESARLDQTGEDRSGLSVLESDSASMYFSVLLGMGLFPSIVLIAASILFSQFRRTKP